MGLLSTVIYTDQLYTGVPTAIILLLVVRYTYRRYATSLVHAPLAKTNNFWLAAFGLVPPPSDTSDKLSEFLIQVGQDRQQTPVSVVWSIMGTPLVLVNTLKGIKDVLIEGQTRQKNKNPATNVQRGNLICFIQNLVFGGKSINNTIGEEWRWRRHVLLPPFQSRQLVPNLLPYVATRTKELLNVFEEHANQGTALEVDELFQNLTMDVINFYLYGRGDLDYDMVGGRTNLKNEHLKLGLGFQSVEAWLPFGINHTNWAQRAFRPSRERLKDFIRDSLQDALAADKQDGTFRSVAACAYASGKYDGKYEDLVNDMLSLTFAGYDTTAHTLAFCFSELAKHPDIQQQLFEQVNAVLGPAPVDPASITAEKLSQIPLLTAVYRETMRKYPAVAFIPVHVNHDTVVDGVVVPRGAEIWCNLRGLQMNQGVFPKPHEFNPFRWIPDNNLPHDKQHEFPDLSFTLGPHSCLGKNLAILELRTVIACTINQFTMSLKPGNIIDTKIVLTTKPRNGVWVHFEKRK
ncbi:cytochrome P450 [Lichtheimia hyalospora FSU 10163]|nr:cytochrome P450 [Lichtheimia hyalospora FSU 10163]